MNTRQIAFSGVALVKSKLMRLGIEASIAPDNNTELWADEQQSRRRIVIKVTTNQKPKPGGGKGALALDWWVKENVQATHVAFVDLSTENVWLLTTEELTELAQQRSGGRRHFYMYIAPNIESRTGKANHITDFDRFLIERRVNALNAQLNTQ
jgi:hypothetical protein